MDARGKPKSWTPVNAQLLDLQKLPGKNHRNRARAANALKPLKLFHDKHSLIALRSCQLA
jgi:hypothetical protein